MPRAVLDTNVLVSVLISPQGPSARLLLELRAGAFELIISPMLLDELREVLLRDKFRPYVTEREVGTYLELIGSEGLVYDDPETSTEPVGPDPDDEYVIDLARVARSDGLVSGDAHLLDLRDSLPVMSPAEFLASLGDD